MNIALVGYEANVPNRVGSNQYAFELLKALYLLDKKNEYLVYLPHPPLPDLPKVRKNWQYCVCGPVKLWNFFGLPRALFKLRPRPDLVFSPGHYSPLFFPAPLVVAIMDLGYLRFPQQFTHLTLTKLKFWTRFSIKRASHLLAISEFTRDDIINTYQIEPACVTATSLGYDRERFKPECSRLKIGKLKEKYGIDGDYLLSLGTLKPSKNIEGLIEAFALLVRSSEFGVRSNLSAEHSVLSPQYSALKLVIAGKKGWLHQEIFNQVKRLGLTNEVVFTGFVEEEEVPALMAGAEVFVMPSFWEGFGIPVLEAMAVGTPVVAAQVASLPEVVSDAGILVDPASFQDIARGIMKAIERKKELSGRGVARAKEFSWAICAQKTLGVLERVGHNYSS